jgi:hypothetical protein
LLGNGDPLIQIGIADRAHDPCSLPFAAAILLICDRRYWLFPQE